MCLSHQGSIYGEDGTMDKDLEEKGAGKGREGAETHAWRNNML